MALLRGGPSLVWIWIVTMVIGSAVGFRVSYKTVENHKILILGAGITGVAAGKALEEAGESDFVILEGSTRIGGRMHSDTISGESVELGAMYVYGKGTNPVWNFNNDFGILMEDDYPDNLIVRGMDGKKVSDFRDVDEKVWEAVQEMDADAKIMQMENLPDVAMSGNLLNNGWNPLNEVEALLETFYIDYEYAAPPATLSTKFSSLNAPFEEHGNDEIALVMDQRGFKTLPESLASGFVDRIEFNKIVQNISQTESGVVVTTSDGSVYSAEYVLVTFSLGVLQERAVTFDPELPHCKQLAIDSFGIAPFNHLYFKFPSVFWDDRTYILLATPRRSAFNTFFNLNQLRPGSNILQLTLWWEEARYMERLTDEEIIDEVMESLQTMYPKAEVPRPTSYSFSRWLSDPLFRGAYSYWPALFTAENQEDLKSPFGRVFFGGEHTNFDQYGFVHGGYTTGVAAAEAMKACLDDPGSCASHSDFPCSGDSEQGDDQGRFG